VNTGGWPIGPGEIAFLIAYLSRRNTALFLGDGGDPIDQFDDAARHARSPGRRLWCRLLKRQFVLFWRWAATRADLVVFHNPVTAERFSRFAKVHETFLRTFVEERDIVQADVVDYKLASEAGSGSLRCLVASRLIPIKGVGDAIDAVDAARREGVDVTLTIAGSGEQEAALREQVQRSGIEAAVRFLGSVPYGAPVLQLLREHDVLLVCNLTAELSRNILLAMSQGCAVVAYENRATGELLRDGENGIVCRERSIRELATGIARLAADRSLLRRISLQGLVTARAHTFEHCHRRRAALISSMNLPDAPRLHAAE
jgi:glycosyltransferase involved in cell wall biosynthesis